MTDSPSTKRARVSPAHTAVTFAMQTHAATTPMLYTTSTSVPLGAGIITPPIHALLVHAQDVFDVVLGPIVSHYLSVEELVSSRAVSKQWNQLLRQDSCGLGNWTWQPSEEQLASVTQRDAAMRNTSSTLRSSLGCQSNIFVSLPAIATLNVFNHIDGENADLEALFRQLIACGSLPIKRLYVHDAPGMSAAVLQALPELELLEDREDSAADAWMEYAPPKLQHIGFLLGNVKPSELPLLAVRCSTLTSIAFDQRHGVWTSDTLYPVLAACQNAVKLYFDGGHHRGEMLDVLCMLPKLRKLIVDDRCGTGANSVDTAFLQRIPHLLAGMYSRLPQKQQFEELFFPGRHINIDISEVTVEQPEQVDPQWLWSAIQASRFCGVFELHDDAVADEMIDDDCTQWRLPSDVDMLATKPDFANRGDALVAYIKMLSYSLNELCLDRGHELTDEHLFKAIAAKPHKALRISCNSPAVVHRALTAGSNLTKLAELDIWWSDSTTTTETNRLAECLQLVQATSRLVEASIEATASEWATVDLSVLRSTAHVAKLHLISEPGDSTLAQRLYVTGLFLQLLNLTTLTETQILKRKDVRAVRAESGLSPVHFFA